MSDFNYIASLLVKWPEWQGQVPEMETSIGARLLCALRDLQAPDREDPGPLDLAGLISHFLRRESLLQGGLEFPLRVPRGGPWPEADIWTRCLCKVVRTSTDHHFLHASAWQPQWLTCPEDHDPLVPALMEEARRSVEQLPADPAIQEVLGVTHYLGPGQRMAVRSALLLRPGGSLLAVLPTGGGKSMVMLAPALLQGGSDGLTLVIVPTVALALDQARRTAALFARYESGHRVGAWAYHGGLEEEEKRAIRQRIREGTQPILFTSPEAAMLSLRPALFQAAQAGRLQAFVIDEAHLVAQWGMEFRPEFQALSGLRRTLLEACGKHPAFRTLLLTATLTEEAFWTLSTLFSDGDLEVCASVSLRPEPDFYVSAASDGEREERIFELAHVLPRPFILYTTTRDDCEAWTRRLRAKGLRRVGNMHGGTPAQQREAVLQRWVNHELDVMVATSAFGLGMDQADIRAVVHACVPETVDRFYQEAGRAGRDGKACLSFLIHTLADINIAKKLNSDRIISIYKGLARWQAMHRSAEVIGDTGSLLVRLDAKPGTVIKDSDANVAWNLRTLVLMARSGLLTLEAHTPPDLKREDGESEEAFGARQQAAFDDYVLIFRVLPASVDHLSESTWRQVVEPHRKASRRADEEANQRVHWLLSGQKTFAEIFEHTYRVDDAGIRVAPSSLSCPTSRREGLPRQGGITPTPQALKLPVWKIGPGLKEAIGTRTSLFISLPQMEPDSRDAQRMQRRLLRLMERLVANGLREISAPDEWLNVRDYRRLYQRAQPRIVLHSLSDRPMTTFEDALAVPRLSLLWPTATHKRLKEILLLERPLHLIFLPEDMKDIDRPDRAFLDTRLHFTIGDFERRLD
jgi:ATP-dependent DNA helicase RecQ